MKKKLLLFGFIGAFGASFGQANPSFETWTGNDPDNWFTWNQYAAIPLGINGLTVEQSTSATNGSLSAKAITKTCPNCSTYGLPNPLPGILEQFEPFSNPVPDSVRFDYKTNAAAISDTAFFQFVFRHWDAVGDSAVIDYSVIGLLSPSANWATRTVQLFPNPNGPGTTDSILWDFFSSGQGFINNGTSTNGTELFVDNISLVYNTTGHEELLSDVISIKAYPTPAIDYVNLETDNADVHRVDILDASGKTVKSELLFTGLNRVDVSEFNSGSYLYIVYANDGRAMKSGRISVIK